VRPLAKDPAIEIAHCHKIPLMTVVLPMGNEDNALENHYKNEAGE
jgi:hypothetical protein